MYELTHYHTGRKENDPSRWPDWNQVIALAVRTRFEAADFFTIRRYFDLPQLDTVQKAASMLGADLITLAKELIYLRERK